MILGYSRGFIQKLSPIRRSRSVKTDWFEFNLQTSPTKKRRVVGFNTSVHTELKELAESKSAVVLTNTKDNDAGDIIFSQRSSARPRLTLILIILFWKKQMGMVHRLPVKFPQR